MYHAIRHSNSRISDSYAVSSADCHVSDSLALYDAHLSNGPLTLLFRSVRENDVLASACFEVASAAAIVYTVALQARHISHYSMVMSILYKVIANNLRQLIIAQCRLHCARSAVREL